MNTQPQLSVIASVYRTGEYYSDDDTVSVLNLTNAVLAEDPKANLPPSFSWCAALWTPSFNNERSFTNIRGSDGEHWIDAGFYTGYFPETKESDYAIDIGENYMAVEKLLPQILKNGRAIVFHSLMLLSPLSLKIETFWNPLLLIFCQTLTQVPEKSPF